MPKPRPTLNYESAHAGRPAPVWQPLPQKLFTGPRFERTQLRLSRWRPWVLTTASVARFLLLALLWLLLLSPILLAWLRH